MTTKKTGDYFLFLSEFSTSIMGVYEVFVESKIKMVIQLLSQQDYKEKTLINKWFIVPTRPLALDSTKTS